MASFSKLFLILLMISISVSCNRDDLGRAPLPDDYDEQFETWTDDRMESLTSPTGWMRLAGMYWLEKGDNTFGTADTVDLRFPDGTIPGFAGTLRFEDGSVHLTAAEDVKITHENEPADDLMIYDGEEALHLEHGTLEWFIIERGDLTGVRLYNKQNSKVDRFTGFDRYPISPDWHLNAKLIPAGEDDTIPVVNVLGQVTNTPTPGTVEFSFGGTVYTLDTIEEGDQMFIIVGDLTNRTETYQAGRYIYIDYPEEGSEYTVIDFNKLYNPPCAYSLFTTCQLPPVQNRLDLAITAGEKRAEGWQGLE